MWSSVFHSILNYIIPPRKTEHLLAHLSLEELLALKITAREGGSAALPYRDSRVTALVWELKYYAQERAEALAGACLQEELLAIAAEEVGTPLVIPVPMHPKRRRERGHNQTEVLCTAALRGVSSSFQYAPEALVRVRDTPPQQSLKKEKRLTNVLMSMRAEPTLIKNRTCIVVDDVTTTGATLHEAKRSLLEAGARKVWCISLAVAT